MNKEEYEAIISQDKLVIVDYMNDIKIEAGNIKTAVAEDGTYYK